MSFNELNSVENFIINQLSGDNLNEDRMSEPGLRTGFHWEYKLADQLDRKVDEVLWESELKDSLIRLNSSIADKPELADEVIYKLRAILISVNQIGLVKENEEIFKWMTGDKTMPFGENNRHIPVKLIDFEHVNKNSFIITNQYRVQQRESKIPDIVLL